MESAKSTTEVLAIDCGTDIVGILDVNTGSYSPYGHDTVHDEIPGQTVLVLLDDPDYVNFGAGVTLDNVVFSRTADSLDLVVTVDWVADDSLTIIDQFQAVNSGPLGVVWFDRVERFQFAEGTYLTDDEVMDQVLENLNTEGDDLIYGFFRPDTLDGGAGDDFLSGGEDNDTYEFGKEFGQDVIEEGQESVLTPSIDRVRFSFDVAPEDVLVARDGDSLDLVLSFTDDAASLTLVDQFAAAYTGVFGTQRFDQVETFEFRDAASTVWTEETIRLRLLAEAKTAGDDEIFGFNFEDTVHDDSRFSGFYTSDDKVVFGTRILLANLTFSRAGDDLAIEVTSPTDILTIEGMFGYSTLGATFDQVEAIKFTDDAANNLDLAGIRATVLQATTGDDTLVGFHVDDTPL